MRLPILALAAVLLAVPTARAAGDKLTLLAFGDSLVHGYGLPQGEPFPAQLEARLHREGYTGVEVVNAGSSGDTSKSGLARLDWVLQEDADAAIVVLGANDALRGIDPAVTRRNLDAILTRLDAAGLQTLLAGMKAPRNLGREYVAEFDAIYPDLAEAHDVVFYPFFLQGVAQRPDLNQSDGIHPNAEGVAVIVDAILPKVEALIERARAQGAS